MSGLPAALLRSLFWTLLFESVFFLLCGKRDRRDLLLCGLLNLLTNPAVVLLYWWAGLCGASLPAAALLLEAAAVAAEGWGYRRFGRSIRRPFGFSLAANAFSYLAGLLLQLARAG